MIEERPTLPRFLRPHVVVGQERRVDPGGDPALLIRRQCIGDRGLVKGPLSVLRRRPRFLNSRRKVATSRSFEEICWIKSKRSPATPTSSTRSASSRSRLPLRKTTTPHGFGIGFLTSRETRSSRSPCALRRSASPAPVVDPQPGDRGSPRDRRKLQNCGSCAVAVLSQYAHFLHRAKDAHALARAEIIYSEEPEGWRVSFGESPTKPTGLQG